MTPQAEIQTFIEEAADPQSVKPRFLSLLNSGVFTRDEGSLDHFCVFFAVIDPKQRQVFLGEHMKAGVWLFSGGHLDPGEGPLHAVLREIDEELGIAEESFRLLPEHLISIKPINNPKYPVCTAHFDLWHFVEVDKQIFKPDQKKLATEFHQTAWLSIDEAQKRTSDDNTCAGLEFVEERLFR